VVGNSGTRRLAFHRSSPQPGLPPDDPVPARYRRALLVWLFAYVQYAAGSTFNTVPGSDEHVVAHGSTKS